MLVQAESGAVSITGSPESPAKIGVSMADSAGGLYAYSSILAALIRRGRTGKGERIDISMLECLTEWMMPPFYVWKGAGRVVARAGVRHNMIVPYGAYACADGPVMFAIQNEREWKRLCDEVLEMPALAADDRYSINARRLANRVELEALIEERFGQFTRAQVLERLDRASIPNGELKDVPHAADHPQLVARHRWTLVESEVGPIPALLPPHNLAHVTPVMGKVPALGEHTKEILAEIEREDHA